MAQPNSHHPTQEGIGFTTVELVANSSQLTSNSIPPLSKAVKVTGVANDANDFIVLPPLNSCPDGHSMIILASAGANFELRTPASSNEEINSEDCDGTKELLVTDTTVVYVVKINNTIGWMSNPYTAIGAVATAVVPD